MKTGFSIIAAVFAGAALLSSAAFAQPATKLTSNLPEATVKAIWCSALFLEESYFYEEDSDDAVYYEDMAYDLGESLDEVMYDIGLPYAESEEIWEIFDYAATDFATEDEDKFLDALDACEAAYVDGKLKLR